MKAGIVSTAQIRALGYRLDARPYLQSNEGEAQEEVRRAKVRLRNAEKKLAEAKALDERLAETGQIQWISK